MELTKAERIYMNLERLRLRLQRVVGDTPEFMMELEGNLRFIRDKQGITWLGRRDSNHTPSSGTDARVGEGLANEWTEEEEAILQILRKYVEALKAINVRDSHFSTILSEPPPRQRLDCTVKTADTETRTPFDKEDAVEEYGNIFRLIFQRYPRVKGRLQDLFIKGEIMVDEIDSTT